MKFIGMKPTPMRIVGIAADIDDAHLVPQPTMTLYTPFGQGPLFGGRLFVHVRTDPYALINPIARTIRNLSVDQPVERAATLEDVRAEVLTPDRLNTMVFGGFAVVALTDCRGGRGGRAGVFRERADARVRHPPGDRVAAASTADAGDRGRHGDYGVRGLAPDWRAGWRCSGWPAVISRTCRCRGCGWWLGGAAVLLAAAVAASAWPAMRAARVDVIQALRAD